MPCIYCDEAGFTGNNLLNPDQPYFVYASVLLDPNEARETVERIMKNYHVQGSELKGRNLVKYNKGRKAITEILEKFSNSVCLCVFQKKYNLACKFLNLFLSQYYQVETIHFMRLASTDLLVTSYTLNFKIHPFTEQNSLRHSRR
jgi:hypothetical protein